VKKQICSLFGGVTVEEAVVEAVLDVLSPGCVEAMVEAKERLEKKKSEKLKQLTLQLERARYEADRCQRQYGAVEPENRLVVRTLESRWNAALERVSELQKEWESAKDAHHEVSDEEHRRLRELALDLPKLWNHPAAAFDLKKRIIRTLIKEIVIYVEKRTLRVMLHWEGGQHTELGLRKRRTGEHRWTTAPDTIKLIKQLARQLPDKQIAAHLNRMGIKTAKGHTWTRIRVGNFRNANNIPNFSPGEREERGELTIDEVAEKLGVSYSTVTRMIRRKQLPAHRACPGAPWIVRGEDLTSARNRPSSDSPDQLILDL
jgi:excisionase family DNA binding protein